MVNRGIREALEKNLTARGSLSKFSKTLAREYRINGSHARRAMDLALALDKGHRRRLRKGVTGRVPYCLRPFLHTDDATFHLDPSTGHLRLSLRNGEWVGFDLRVSDHHRGTLQRGKLKQLRLTPGRAIPIIERTVPEPYLPRTVLALDTNDRWTGWRYPPDRWLRSRFPTQKSPASNTDTLSVVGSWQGRRPTTEGSAGDGGGREGRREHARVSQILHLLSKGLVETARRRRAVMVLEDLHLPRGGGRNRRLRRRLSSWPQRELHRQIEYKAEERGVPIIHVNPQYTSKTCPRCGEVKERRSRVGRVFMCERCGVGGAIVS